MGVDNQEISFWILSDLPIKLICIYKDQDQKEETIEEPGDPVAARLLLSRYLSGKAIGGRNA